MKYHVNKNAQTTGEHEVHNETCTRCPEAKNRVHLGDFASCGPAVTEARKLYTNVDGCAYCSPDCHTR